MRKFVIAWLLVVVASTASAESPATLRVDYYHSGNAETEMFSLDRVVREPLPWPGNLSRPIDETLRGKYAFEIVEAASGAFEGANYQARGFYRSEMNCIMFTRTEDFCRVCADAIERVIDEYTRR